MDLKEKVQAVLDSNLTTYRLYKLTGISNSNIEGLRNGSIDINLMSLKNAYKLANCYDAAVLDLVAQGDENITNVKPVLREQFKEILGSQLDLIKDDESLPDDERVFNLLNGLFRRVLNDNELITELAPYYLSKHKPNENDIQTL